MLKQTTANTYMLAFGIWVLAVAITGKSSAAQDPQSEPKPNPDLASQPIAALASWYKMPSVPFSSLGENYEQLELKEAPTKDPRVLVTAEQKAAVSGAIRQLITMLRAPDIEAFRGALKTKPETSVRLSPAGQKKINYTMSTARLVEAPQSLTEDELVEAYWTYTTKLGRCQQYYTAFIPSDSYYTFHELKTKKEISDIPPLSEEDREKTGMIGEFSSFIFDGALPDQELKQSRRVAVIDIRFNIKTSVTNVAYPIVYRMWWSSIRKAWTPLFAYTYNSTNTRAMNIVF